MQPPRQKLTPGRSEHQLLNIQRRQHPPQRGLPLSKLSVRQRRYRTRQRRCCIHALRAADVHPGEAAEQVVAPGQRRAARWKPPGAQLKDCDRLRSREA